MIAATAIAILVASIFLGFWPLSLFILDPWDAIPKASPEEIAKLHQPDALRADLVDERWVARFPQPLGDRLKSLIENPDQ